MALGFSISILTNNKQPSQAEERPPSVGAGPTAAREDGLHLSVHREALDLGDGCCSNRMCQFSRANLDILPVSDSLHGSM